MRMDIVGPFPPSQGQKKFVDTKLVEFYVNLGIKHVTS